MRDCQRSMLLFQCKSLVWSRTAVVSAITLLTALLLSSCSQLSNKSSTTGSNDPFDGFDIEVRIDGQPTIHREEIALADVAGVHGRKTNWKAAAPSNGKPCFEFRVANAEALGVVKDSELQIIEYRTDREHYRWRDFKTKPDARMLPPYSSKLIEPGKSYCPTEYFLTERLTFGRLPAGLYYVALRVGGTKRWDRQEILLEVKD